MPLYMDIHEVEGATAEAVADAHAADMRIQAQYGVEYHKYWLNERSGKIFCLCTAPNAEAAAKVHQEAHGLLAVKIIEVDPEMAEGLLGACEVNAAGAVLMPNMQDRDPGLRTVMFTDIVESTALTQQLGDEAAMSIINAHDRIVRKALQHFHGREIKHTGDGIMASFVSAVAAVQCAVSIQQELLQLQQPDLPNVQVRIGLAAGEPVESHADLFGTTVQLAARLCAQAEPAQCLVSNAIAELCLGKALKFFDLGERPLKGFTRPVHVHAIEYQI